MGYVKEDRRLLSIIEIGPQPGDPPVLGATAESKTLRGALSTMLIAYVVTDKEVTLGASWRRRRCYAARDAFGAGAQNCPAARNRVTATIHTQLVISLFCGSLRLDFRSPAARDIYQ